MYRLLIVEDEATIAHLLCEQLARWGFEAVCCEDFQRVLECFQREKPDLVLMDVSLPYYNGFYWCSEVRKSSTVPVVFLSSHTESMDIVMAVNMGGDDYVVKPFSMDVLIAKLTAVLRRAYGYARETPRLSVRGLTLDASASTLTGDGVSVELTKNETRVLSLLLERRGEIASREALMQRLWDTGEFVDDNTLTVNVNRLRKKLDSAGVTDLIQTKKGQGYLIDA